MRRLSYYTAVTFCTLRNQIEFRCIQSATNFNCVNGKQILRLITRFSTSTSFKEQFCLKSANHNSSLARIYILNVCQPPFFSRVAIFTILLGNMSDFLQITRFFFWLYEICSVSPWISFNLTLIGFYLEVCWRFDFVTFFNCSLLFSNICRFNLLFIFIVNIYAVWSRPEQIYLNTDKP